MKKILIFMIALISMITPACAESGADTDDIYGVCRSVSSLSEDSKEILDNMGVQSLADSVKVSFDEIINCVIEETKECINGPVKLFGLLVGISVLTALYNILSNDKNKGFSAFSGMLCAGTIATTSVLEKINDISSALDEGCNFVASFVPAMSSVMVAGGNPVTAGAYNMMLLFSSQFAMYLSNGTVKSLLGCYLAVCLIAGINPTLNMSGLANGIKKTAIWVIGIISTLFVSLLSIEGIAGKATDTVALKTARFALNSTIPIVGSALSDALVSVEGTVGILRTSVGTFGIISGIAIVLPGIISVVLMKISVEVAAIISEMLGADRLSELYKNMGAVMTILLSLVLFFVLVLLVSTTLVMLICS